MKKKLMRIALSCVLVLSGVAPFIPAQAREEAKIAFQTSRDKGKLDILWGMRIYVMDVDGDNQHDLTGGEFFEVEVIEPYDQSPDWSPDGKSIVFYSSRDGDFEIYVMGADGKNQRQITDNAPSDGNPAWHPYAQRIAFWSERDGNSEIYVMDADGKKQRRLAAVPGSDKNPAWFDRAGYPVSFGGKLRATWGWLKQKSE